MNTLHRLTIHFLLSVLALGLTGTSLYAQEPLASDEPIHIEADLMESSQKDNLVTFRGNVQAIQGKLTINSDTMIVHYARQADNSAAIKENKQQIMLMK